LDEPFSNLDQIVKDVLKKVLGELLKKLKITCILVSHDAEDTLPWADEILVLRNGKLVQQGKPTEVYFYSLSEYVGGLFGKYSTLSKGLAQFFRFKDQTIYRPEQFKISNRASAKAKRGKVTEVRFFGSHQLISVSIRSDQLYVQEKIGVKWVVGDRVYISPKRIGSAMG
jgi:iron(III) transport system ATP-binding protein